MMFLIGVGFVAGFIVGLIVRGGGIDKKEERECRKEIDDLPKVGRDRHIALASKKITTTFARGRFEYDVFNRDLAGSNYWAGANSFVENSNWDSIIQRASSGGDLGVISVESCGGVFKIFERKVPLGERRQWYAVLLFFPREGITSIDVVKVEKSGFGSDLDWSGVESLDEDEDFSGWHFENGEVIHGESKISEVSRRLTSSASCGVHKQRWLMINTKLMEATIFFDS